MNQPIFVSNQSEMTRKKGDFVFQTCHVIEIVTKLFLVVQNATAKPPEVHISTEYVFPPPSFEYASLSILSILATPFCAQIRGQLRPADRSPELQVLNARRRSSVAGARRRRPVADQLRFGCQVHAARQSHGDHRVGQTYKTTTNGHTQGLSCERKYKSSNFKQTNKISKQYITNTRIKCQYLEIKHGHSPFLNTQIAI